MLSFNRKRETILTVKRHSVRTAAFPGPRTYPSAFNQALSVAEPIISEIKRYHIEKINVPELLLPQQRGHNGFPVYDAIYPSQQQLSASRNAVTWNVGTWLMQHVSWNETPLCKHAKWWRANNIQVNSGVKKQQINKDGTNSTQCSRMFSPC